MRKDELIKKNEKKDGLKCTPCGKEVIKREKNMQKG